VDHLVAVQTAGREHRQRQRRIGEGRVLAAIDPQQGLGPGRHAGTLAGRLLHQDQVELTAVVEPLQLAAQPAGHLQAQAGMLAAEGGQERGQPAGGEVLRQAEAQHLVERRVAEQVGRLFGQHHQPARVAEQALAVLARPHRAGTALQQRPADRLLEAADLLADGRLGQVQPFGGAGEAGAVDYRHEALQQGQVEHGIFQ